MKDGILTGDMTLTHGWVFTTKTGLYGTNYLQRALITAIGLGANRPQDAVYSDLRRPHDPWLLRRRKEIRDALPQGQLHL